MKKAFDQTVCDLKRKVNKKVLKIPEIEQKVLDATSNEPCDPPCTLLADIAQASRNYHERQMIMKIIWKRINDTGRNWRHVHKALAVLEYMVANGSERVIDDIRECASQIQALNGFQYIDSSGRDQGNDVRTRAQSLVVLVNNEGRIAEARQSNSFQRFLHNSFDIYEKKYHEYIGCWLPGSEDPFLASKAISGPTYSLPEAPTSAPPNSATGLPPQPLPPSGVTPGNPSMRGGKSSVWAEAMSRLKKLNIFGCVGMNMSFRLGKGKGGGGGMDLNMDIRLGKEKGGGPDVGVDMGIKLGKNQGGGPGVGVDTGIRTGNGKGGGHGHGQQSGHGDEHKHQHGDESGTDAAG